MSYKVQNLTKQQITTSLLPTEFYEAFNLFQEKKSSINPDLFARLSFIATKLLTHYADEKKKQYLFLLSDEKKEEPDPKVVKLVENTSKELQIKIFIETVKSLFPESKVYFPNMNKKGVLYVRSQTLKMWRERVLELNYNDKILSITKIAQKKHGDKDLDLNTYSLKWIGKVKNRFSFRLDSLSSKNKYKNFRIASEFFEIAVEWHENIKATLLPQLTLTDFEEIKNKYQDIYSGREKEEVVGFAEEIDSGTKGKKGLLNSLFGKSSRNSDKIKSFDSNTATRETKSFEPKIISSAIYESPIEKEKIPDKDEQKLSQSVFPALEGNRTKTKSPTGIMKNLSDPELIQPKEKTKSVSIQTREAEKNLTVEKNNFVVAMLKKNCSIGEEDEAKENEDHSLEPSIKSPDELQMSIESPFIQQESSIFSVLNRKSSCPSLVQDILCNIDKEDLISELGYSMLQSFENFRILQNNTETTKYKLFIKTKTLSLKDVIRSFVDPLRYKVLNNEIAELKIMSIIQYNKSAIIYEKRKAYGRLYLPREFVYMRYMYENKDSLIIVDRSIDFNDIPHSYFNPTIRGTIESNVIYIYRGAQNNEINICFNINSTNNGVVSTSQDHDINFTYLKEFKNLEARISHSEEPEEPEESKVEPSREMSFAAQKVPALDEKTIRRKTKLMTPMDYDNKDKILSGLLIKEEDSEPLESKKRSTSADIALKKKDFDSDKLEEVNKNTVEKEIVYRNREVSFAFQKSAEMLQEMVESNLHVIKCITNRHFTGCRDVKNPRFQQSNEIEGHYALKRTDWISNKSGGFIYHNQKVLDVQKKILGYLLKRMGTNLIQAKSIMSISLPIELFETKSHLEKLANNFTFAPHLLCKANELNDPLEQIKYTVTFFITALLMATAQLKPFNPILGETFQGRINGMPIYFEQISHHPPISAFLLYGPEFKMIGQYEAHASLHANSCAVSILGQPRVIFKNGTVVYTSIPTAHIGGTSFGQRTFNYEGKMYAYEPKHRMACEITFNPDKKGIVGGLFSKQANPADYFSGGIYQVTPECISSMKNTPVLNKYTGINMKEDVLKELSKASGIWHHHVDFDGTRLWEFGKCEAYEVEYERNPLPSDSIYREDLISWKSEDVQKAQLVKEKMENIQRADKKLRGKLHKVKGKKGHHEAKR